MPSNYKTVDDAGYDHCYCEYSSDLTGGVSAGQGELDYNGFWEFDCPPCAKKMSEKIYLRTVHHV